MTFTLVMPALGESVSEGTVTRWLKSEGDEVVAGQPLLEVSTDKVDTEIEAPISGILHTILVAEDATVAVGAPLASINSKDDASFPVASSPAPISNPSEEVEVADAVNLPLGSATRAPYLTPAVRKLLRDSGVNASLIQGTGRNGRVTKRDVEAATVTATPAQAPDADSTGAPSMSPQTLDIRTVKMTRLRAVIASRMVASLHTSAQLTTVVEVDLTTIARLRALHNETTLGTSARLSYLPFVARATCLTLAQHPILNASIDTTAGTITYHDSIDLGIAVDTERGLLVPVVRDALDLTVTGLARHINASAVRTREGTISPDELDGGTFTITNTGSRGALFDTPILNSPQVGILGFGAVVKRPVVITSADGEDLISVRPMAFFSLTYDHQLVDGADAARFLSDLKIRLESGDVGGV